MPALLSQGLVSFGSPRWGRQGWFSLTIWSSSREAPGRTENCRQVTGQPPEGSSTFCDREGQLLRRSRNSVPAARIQGAGACGVGSKAKGQERGSRAAEFSSCWQQKSNHRVEEKGPRGSDRGWEAGQRGDGQQQGKVTAGTRGGLGTKGKLQWMDRE